MKGRDCQDDSALDSKSALLLLREIKFYDIKDTLRFPGEETSLGRGGFPHIFPWEMPHARPALIAVFSITQFDISITPSSIIDIKDLEAQPPVIYRGKLIDNRERDVLHCI
jgi:hypothetical protein